jgi:exopolysaccharide production protein ExoZ
MSTQRRGRCPRPGESIRRKRDRSASFVDLLKSLAFIPFQKGKEVVPVLFLGWTLNYEMFFYLLFAISMAACHRYRAVVSSAILLAVVACGYLVSCESVPFQFFTQPIILKFAFGMFCYALFIRTATYRTRDRPITSRIPWTLVGGALIVCMPLAIPLAPVENRIIRWGILAALSFYCIVYGLSGVKLPRVLLLVGDASYSLYLFHPYVIQLFAKVFGFFSGNNVYAYFTACVAMLLCCVLSVLLYKYIEKPLTELLRRRFVDGDPGAGRRGYS